MSEERPIRRSPRFSDGTPPSGTCLKTAVSSSPVGGRSRRGDALTLVAFDLEMAERRRSPRISSATPIAEKRAVPWPKQKDAKEKDGKEKDAGAEKLPAKRLRGGSSSSKKKRKGESEESSAPFFVGDPVPDNEARRRWPWRYEEKGQERSKQCTNFINDDDDEDDVLVTNAKCHYLQAEVEKCIFNLGDHAYIKGKPGGQNYIGIILEFFKTVADIDYCRIQWLYRAEDTVIKEESASHDERRLFFSDMMNDNLLDCIISKLSIIHVAFRVDMKSKILPCNYFYDMKYSVDYSTFSTMLTDKNNISSSPCVKTEHMNKVQPKIEDVHKTSELALLDIYSGCGGMSTGLCLGAKFSGVDLVTRWAVDITKSACDSLKLNHPMTQVRNESAEDFLGLLKEWNKLCERYADNVVGKTTREHFRILRETQDSKNDTSSEEEEVTALVGICYGDPTKTGKRGLKFKVRWAGYGPKDDTWEPAEGLRNCQELVRDFVLKGLKGKMLPRPGGVDVICGGPPCQGISGYNRHRNEDSPLEDEKNRQIIVFMDLVKFLKPKYILMENVVDILRFAKGSLAKYAVSRLVQMNYQARLGIMAAGSYGLPQFRLRVFLWGAHPLERLPQFPLPTHDVIFKYGSPSDFERNVVAYDEDQPRNLEQALVLRDAISDLPPVTSDETREEMFYKSDPETDFQCCIRATKRGSFGKIKAEKPLLFDHRPEKLSEDDFARVCRIPHKKGANFRDLPGVIVGPDNVVRRDPKSNLKVPSGKPLVPDYAFSFCQGKSSKPFGRLWWDETIATVICRPQPHTQAILHPEQDRVLTIRELARVQGFPDHYRFSGTVKERYAQIGNAVAIPVARALGYALGMAIQNLSGDGHLMTLPPELFKYTFIE